MSGKSYTLYAGSEEEREEWKRDLENAVMLRKAVVDGNKVSYSWGRITFFLLTNKLQFFACNTINEGFFRPAPNVVISSTKTKYTGKITCATPLQG